MCIRKRTCVSEASSLTKKKKDLLIVWFNNINNSGNKNTLRKFANSFKNTNLLVISKPYRNCNLSKWRDNDLIYEFNLTLFEEAQLASKYSKVNFFECNNIINAHSFAKKSEYLKNSAKYSLCREIINFLKFGGQKDPVIKLVTEENIEKNYGSNETESSPQIMSPISPDVSSETALIIIDINDSHDNEDNDKTENIQ